LAGDSSFSARIQKTVPSEFVSFLHEPAFSMDSASFCLWRRHTDQAWTVVTPANGHVSPDGDGSAELLGILDGDPETYRLWAVDYYEREISPAAVRAVYEHQVLSDHVLAALNPEIVLADIA